MVAEAGQVVRIGSASGAVTDLPDNLAVLARDADVDFIIGDWMSEYNMTMRGAAKASRNRNSTSSSPESDQGEYEDQFLESLELAVDDLARRHTRLVVNAGASDPQKLHDQVVALVEDRALALKVAWIEGDEVLSAVAQCRAEGQDFRNITTGQMLSQWAHTPLYAQCYLGCWGIVEALKAGADIVICGRVADASPTMAAAAFWHEWSRQQFRELAHSLVAGHLIECSFYVTGGNFSGFKSLPKGASALLDPPVAHVFPDGTFEIRKHATGNRSGHVSRDTCRSQLLYEIQGRRYYNADVVAVLDQVKMEERGENVVYVYNIGFEKPPPTTKVGITAQGGFQAEAHYFLTGLDVKEKAALLEHQLRTLLDVKSFSTLKFTTSGTAAPDPESQDAATVDLRIFAQSASKEALMPAKFIRPCFNIIMSTYPGATFAIDTRQGLPKPYLEYFVAILPQSLVRHRAHLPGLAQTINIPAPTDTKPFLYHQEIEECTDPKPLSSFGPSTVAPLGFVVHARSGDKSSDCNIGFYVRYEDEYEWLKSLLSVEKIKQLLQDDYKGGRIERFELPNIQGQWIFFHLV